MTVDRETAPRRQALAEPLLSTVAQATNQLSARPLPAVMHVVDVLAGDVLPRLAARGLGTSSLYLELSEATEALTIIALRASLRRGASAQLRLAHAQLENLRALAVGLAEIESEHSSQAVELDEQEDAARQGLHFIAPPRRPATEAHVLRHAPRSVETWSPERTPGAGHRR